MNSSNRPFPTSPTSWSLVALLSGLVLGITGYLSGSPAIQGLSLLVQPLGVVWLRALQLIVIPLIVFQLLTALTAGDNGGGLGRNGAWAFVGITVGSVAVMLASLGLALPVVRLYKVSPEAVEAVRSSVSLDAVQGAGSAEALSFGDWITNLIPINIFEAFLNGQILQILLITIAFGLAVGQLPEGPKKTLGNLFSNLNEVLMVLIRWILVVMPVGVFALMLGLALSTGTSAAGIVVVYLIISQGIQGVIVLALYPVAAILGGTSLRDFAKAVAPVQLVALSTRSSLATMPVQVESGIKRLGFGPRTAGVLVPLSVTFFKISSLASDPARVLFLAHVFGISISPGQLVIFLVSCLLLNFGSVGIPRGPERFRDLPVYVAAGIPAEGFIILQVSGDLEDYADTLANATGMFAMATALSRGDRRGDGAV